VVETGLEERARRNEWSPTKAGLTVGREWVLIGVEGMYKA
jgi:hypothetical protein